MPIRGPDQMGLRDGGREQRRESCGTGGRGSIIVLSLGKTKRKTKSIASKEGTSARVAEQRGYARRFDWHGADQRENKSWRSVFTWGWDR